MARQEIDVLHFPRTAKVSELTAAKGCQTNRNSIQRAMTKLVTLRTLPLRYLLPLALLTLLARPARTAASVEEQVQAIGQRYNQVEKQLDRAIHYIKKETSGNATTTQQAWCNATDDPLKITTEQSENGKRELTEYVALNFESPGSGLFVLKRRETPLPDGGIEVDESRRYIGSRPFKNENGAGEENGVLIRELRKHAAFKPGEALDTAHIKNEMVDVAAEEKDQARAATTEGNRVADLLNEPDKILTALRNAGPPQSNPFAPGKGDSARYRLIQGTVSPDGRYAIAIGFPHPVKWETLIDSDFEGGQIYTAEDTPDRHNYLIDLTAARILGDTHGDYFGTRHNYNHRGCSVEWSPDSSSFVELTTNKWDYSSCRAGRIGGGGSKLLGTVDLGKEAEKSAAAFQRAHKNRVHGSIAISIGNVANDGTIDLTLVGQEASGERKGDTDFSVDEELRLRETGAGLHLETVSVKKSPEEGAGN